jgi:flagellar hook assembly protein FlgD
MDIVNDLDALRATPPSNVADPNRNTDELGRDAFLRIFLTQLKSQDPLSPQDSSELGAQLAQFSQLEAQVNSRTELQSIGASLKELIELTRGGGSSLRLDPVSLIGRDIEFPEDTLLVGGAQAPPALSTKLTEDRTGLVIQVVDVATGEAGVFSVASERGSQVLPLPRGEYTLRIEGTTATLDGPTAAGTITFTKLERVGDTLVEVRDADGEPAPFSFTPGKRYRISVQAIDVTGQEPALALETVRTARADSVQIVDGTARILSAGASVDPADIRGIRAAGTPPLRPTQGDN